VDPRTADVIVYDVLSTARGSSDAEVVGRASFRNGRTSVEAPEAIRIAIEELLARAFVDRVQADERPRGYRRSGRGRVDRLVPGMAEHFIARMRGLWLSYPDGSVVTAREAGAGPATAITVVDTAEAAPPITDPSIRRATLRVADEALGGRSLVRAHPPETGIRPLRLSESIGEGPVGRTDCGWLV
jgi:hypothetical protein